MGAVSITGEISLVWHDNDPYGGEVLLISLDTDEPLAMNTFEVGGPLAERLSGVLEEGLRVRVDCRSETVEVVNIENGETSDKDQPVVVDLVVLPAP